MTTSTMMTNYNQQRIIRFQSLDGRVLYGHPNSAINSAAIVRDLLDFEPTGERVGVHHVLAPIESPPAIFCLGLNYRKHAEEIKTPIPEFPIVFIKTNNTLTGPNTNIIIPKCASDPPEVDYEVELAVILKKACRDVRVEDAMEMVLGFTVANDVSARRWQGAKRGGGQWCRSKCFDTFLPLGPALVLNDGQIDPHHLRLSTTVNNEVRQNASTADMIFNVPQLISFLSQDTTLQAGTVILTGTPEGVGFTRKPPLYLAHGDHVTVSIDQIGSLSNDVITAQ
jgi:2-keto-4-pentenoate hydratase/2-oxohepta-3-ene-1,7-dioic acid hydratase in catechol pathway